MAGMLMLIVGSIDFFQGLIALFEDECFVVSQSGFLVLDLLGLFGDSQYPFWPLSVIALNVIVLYALAKARRTSTPHADGLPVINLA